MTKGTTARRARGGGNARDLYADVTAKIIAELEQGRFPWVQPWDAAPTMPRNAVTGRRYSGVNILLLWTAAMGAGYPSQSWLTFRQALAAGGNVRKGEKGSLVVYSDRFIPDAEKARAAQSGDEPNAIPFLKCFTVFNVAQCEGLPEKIAGDPAPRPLPEVVPEAEALIAATGADFRIGGNDAFYVPAQDYVQVPPLAAFRNANDFYDTAFHELSHWTGGAKRLGREMKGGFGSPEYAREELIAEISSAFIGATLGLVPTVRHADYLGYWLDILREDKRAIFRATAQATRAADYILAFREGEERREAA
ncbi:MAG TPA: zincin-like metallopeptidase domain-containing protein [Sphingopyxis sp.]|uniref:ArdC family protein n=1 Tax=Sphingopyxis sp. TaxID=1908224 RepID=UPI002E3809D4|nr:zincin-like metallopeptidase domain-containing protein [Sphingopyxis sp.]HEX2814609.1 zincin-like metallopeptidase domain-containing protein [Sphingopyxis sp.]